MHPRSPLPQPAYERIRLGRWIPVVSTSSKRRNGWAARHTAYAVRRTGPNAAPGAAVELLRNGETYDRAIADQFGHFVMVPSRLPPGDYELTLRSRQPNGNHATSRRSAAVAVQPGMTDQNMALMTPDKASVVLSKPVVPSALRHPPRARREATGPAAQDLSGLRRKLFNHLVGPHH